MSEKQDKLYDAQLTPASSGVNSLSGAFPEQETDSQSAPQQTVHLTIGLPVHNEEKNISAFLRKLDENVRRLPAYVNIETIACVNGCKDRSKEILMRRLSQPIAERLNLSVVESDTGKLNAQLKILDVRQQKDAIIAYMDTDTYPDVDVLPKLFDRLHNDDNAFVTFARVEPYFPEGESLSEFQKDLRAEYASRAFREPKPYIHGRAFMMRDAGLLFAIHDDVPNRVNCLEPELVDRFKLKKGAFTDDIYLSRIIALEYGQKSIVEVADAKTYFHPPKTPDDLFKAIRRTATELHRLGLIHPQFGDLNWKRDGDRLNQERLPDMMHEEDNLRLRRNVQMQVDFWVECQEALTQNIYPDKVSKKAPEWEVLETTKDSFGLPMRVVSLDKKVDMDLITSVHVIAYTPAGDIVMIEQNDARGWDVPGGHIEPKLDNHAIDTIKRESYEEAAVLFDEHSIQPCCFIEVDPLGQVVPTYMAYYIAEVDAIDEQVYPNGEVLDRDIVSQDDFLEKFGGDRKQMTEILQYAGKARDQFLQHRPQSNTYDEPVV